MMNATTIKTEIEKLSGYSFQDFQARCRSLAFDCALVMQEVKAKYGRMITGDFMQSELGLAPRFVDTYRKVMRSKVADFDAGFKMSYIIQLQRELEVKGEKKKYSGITPGKYSAGKYHTYKTRLNAKTFVK